MTAQASRPVEASRGKLSFARQDLALNPDVPVTSQTSQTFLLQAKDDHVDNVDDSLAYYIALKKGVPVEMHLYGHRGMRLGCGPRSFR